MQYKFFVIPVSDSVICEEELNRFLRGHRIVSVQRELVREGNAAYWALCVEYLPGLTGNGQAVKPGGRTRIDYKEVLSEEDFAIFIRLRDRRKALAESEAVPVYAVCTNEQLSEMAKRRVDSLSALQQIEGFGEAKAAKYGNAFLEVLRDAGVKNVPAG